MISTKWSKQYVVLFDLLHKLGVKVAVKGKYYWHPSFLMLGYEDPEEYVDWD